MKEYRIQNPEVRSRFKKACILSSIFCFLSFASSLHAEPRIPEKFTYYVFWAGIRAGMATLVSEDSPEGVIIKSRLTSASFISVFYPVEDISQSTLYSSRYPKEYILKIQEGRHRRDRVTYFDIKTEGGRQKVVYNDRLKDETKEYFLGKQAFDPLSGFYEIRHRPLRVGHSEYMDVFDSKKLYKVEVQVLKKERIQTPLGEFDTILIKPLLKSEGLFMQKGDFYIWLTDDEKRIPVLIKSKVKIGNFTAHLVEGVY